MSNEKKDEKHFGRKPKGSNMKSNSSWVSTVPNGKLNGETRWGKDVEIQFDHYGWYRK